MVNDSNSGSRRPPAFATTHWSVVHAAGRKSSAKSRQALEALCQAYWYPLYAFARRRGSDRYEAQDLTQAFFAELLEKDYVSEATPERGRFRAFLLTAFKHFLSKERDKAKAQKRGGGRSPISLDFDAGDSRYRIEPTTDLTPEQVFDRQWAMTLLTRIMDDLAAEYTGAGKAYHFKLLKGFIIGEHSSTTYREVAEELGTTQAAAKMAAHRMRRRYRELLREEILQTVTGPDEVNEEIQNLFTTLGR
jgi:RNA polymerase sigma factor (sigma-70 family)